MFFIETIKAINLTIKASDLFNVNNFCKTFSTLQTSTTLFMLGRRLRPMKLDTGPGTRKSSTLCSLLLLRLVIATLLLCEVPGQMKEEFVGVANHKKIGYEVTLVNYTIELKETNFNSDEYRKRFPNACDVKIDNKTM